MKTKKLIFWTSGTINDLLLLNKSLAETRLMNLFIFEKIKSDIHQYTSSGIANS